MGLGAVERSNGFRHVEGRLEFEGLFCLVLVWCTSTLNSQNVAFHHG